MNISSTFIFESENTTLLPPRLLKVFINNLFRFGRKETTIVNERVHLYLTYSPKNETVLKKLENLPVRYIRVVAEDEEELQLFIKGMEIFNNVNFCIDDVAKKEEQPQPQRRKIQLLENRILVPAKGKKRQAPVTESVTSLTNILDDDDDNDDEDLSYQKRGKKMGYSLSSSSLMQVMDDEEDNYESQKYNVV